MQRRTLRCLGEADIMYNRITAARLTSPISGVVQLSPKQIKKLERVQADQAETRDRLRELAQESLLRRPLRSLGGSLYIESEEIRRGAMNLRETIERFREIVLSEEDLFYDPPSKIAFEAHVQMIDGKHYKFWRVRVDKFGGMTRWWGRIGTNGQRKTEQFGSYYSAVSEAKKLLGEKLGKGYHMVPIPQGKPKSFTPSKPAEMEPGAKGMELSTAKPTPPAPSMAHLAYGDPSQFHWEDVMDLRDAIQHFREIETLAEDFFAHPPKSPAKIDYEASAEMDEGKHYKFWRVRVSGNEMTRWWGRIGTKGQRKHESFSTPEWAVREAKKLFGEKLAKGYYGKPVQKFTQYPPIAPSVVAKSEPPSQGMELSTNKPTAPAPSMAHLAYRSPSQFHWE